MYSWEVSLYRVDTSLADSSLFKCIHSHNTQMHWLTVSVVFHRAEHHKYKLYHLYVIQLGEFQVAIWFQSKYNGCLKVVQLNVIVRLCQLQLFILVQVAVMSFTSHVLSLILQLLISFK